jgi:hypothetical protein
MPSVSPTLLNSARRTSEPTDVEAYRSVAWAVMRCSIRARVSRVGAAVAVGSVLLAPGATSAGVVPDPIPVPSLPNIANPTAESARLVPVPAGCTAPPEEQMVFVGTLVTNDMSTGRFQVERVRAGSVDGFAVDGLIDVRYGDEVRFLDRGTSYLVGAAVDPAVGVLSSRVSESAPLFGGNEIAGVDDSDVACPRFEDPVRTLLADNTSVESGVLSPLGDAKGQILRAFLDPLAVAFAILCGLVLVKHLFFAMGRALRDLGSRESAERDRQHRAVDSAAGEGFDGSGPQIVDGMREPERIAEQGAAGDQHVRSR